jgi:TPR repeat protein
MEWLEKVIILIEPMKNIELYLIVVLFFFTLWFIYSTIKYYKGEKRKVKHLHRFARQGETLSQYELAKRYAKGQAVRKSCQNAASFSQKAAFSGDKDAQKLFEKIIKNRSC